MEQNVNGKLNGENGQICPTEGIALDPLLQLRAVRSDLPGTGAGGDRIGEDFCAGGVVREEYYAVQLIF